MRVAAKGDRQVGDVVEVSRPTLSSDMGAAREVELELRIVEPADVRAARALGWVGEALERDAAAQLKQDPLRLKLDLGVAVVIPRRQQHVDALGLVMVCVARMPAVGAIVVVPDTCPRARSHLVVEIGAYLRGMYRSSISQ